MTTYVIVVGIVNYKDKVLLLKRGIERRSSPGKWQFVSGFIMEKESAEDAALREVKEETGLDGKIVRSGESFETTDQWGRWIIAPFLIKVDSDAVRIDTREHSEYRWVLPNEVSDFDCVAPIEQEMRLDGL
jgi:8-oxo-dGTP pyrophosphatase MutT (NUDIX family)